MKNMSRLVVSTLLIIFAISISSPAHAEPTQNSRSTTESTTQLAPYRYLENESGNGIGVSYSNTTQPYDEILRPWASTDDWPLYWDKVYSFYIGTGYCADAWFRARGAWIFRDVVKGPREFVTPSISGEATSAWAVRNVRTC